MNVIDLTGRKRANKYQINNFCIYFSTLFTQPPVNPLKLNHEKFTAMNQFIYNDMQSPEEM